MDEYHREKEPCLPYQGRQLFPFFLERFYDTGVELPLEIFVISPNESFEDPAYLPLTLEQTHEKFSWEQIAPRTFRSRTFPVTFRFFCTCVPSNDPRNERQISLWKGRLKDPEIMDPYIQTPADREFIRHFYQAWQTVLKGVEMQGGISFLFSFAVLR